MLRINLNKGSEEKETSATRMGEFPKDGSATNSDALRQPKYKIVMTTDKTVLSWVGVDKEKNNSNKE
jgi:hypothetical protein